MDILSLVTVLSFSIGCLADQRPNIVVIVADDLGYNDVSFHGSNQIPTPNIDALAYSGIILNNYYVSPICTPTRGALMSGRHPIHTGLQHSVIFASEKYGLPLKEKIMPQWFKDLGYRTHMVGKKYGLPLEEKIMPEWFKDLGYRTHMIGKWHLGMFADEYLPTYRGFESHYGYYQGCEDYYDHTYEAVPEYWGIDWRRNLDLIRNETNMYSTDLFTQEAVNVINNHNTSEPLFLYLPHQAVHSGNTGGDPLQAPQHYVDRFLHIKNYHRRLYAGMLAALDDSIGQVVKTLTDKQMMDNTIIVFTTDNGGPANGFDANAANNFPLRGVKATLWEGGVRGVGFIHSPLLKKQRYVSNHMLHVCDWLPTLYSAAGGKVSDLKNLDGVDQWKSLSDNKKGLRTEMLHNIDPHGNGKAALRVGDYKILVGDVGMAWDDWYPPWQNPTDSDRYHVNNTVKYGHIKDISTSQNFNGITNKEDDSLVYEMNIDNTKSLLKQSMESYNHNGLPVKVDCGIKPANASTNCDPRVSPCLYNIALDPCEYNNIADSNKDIVIEMMVKLMQYGNTAVPPLNTPVDPAGNPKYHNGAWVPWVKL
ncbi:hypothetical protein ACF0H5_012145 [Mactra antiquata]